MHSAFSALQPYPFERLQALLEGARPPADRALIRLSIGEPKHAPPAMVLTALADSMARLGEYPATAGLPQLREAMAGWLSRRFNLPTPLDPATQVLPVAGTREALFAIAQAVVAPGTDAKVVMPNPFYQIYEGAALFAGAEPYFVNATAATGFKADYAFVPAAVWEKCALLYVCSPGNPTGAVLELDDYRELLALADRYGFIVAADECYSEIYPVGAEPPLGLLEACARLGRTDFERCIVFHSLSKRSNLPGLRSGLVAGDAALLKNFLRYRTYQGCALPVPTQLASIAAWNDEAHVAANRASYQEKFSRVTPIIASALPCETPAAAFYLWLETPVDDQQFCRALFEDAHVLVLPGQFLARPTDNGNPGERRVRLALVAELDECVEAAERLAEHVRRRY